MQFFRPFFLGLFFILFTSKLFATHYYGLDLFYTHLTGNTYRVTMVAFGDCSGAQFPSFSAARPLIHIRRGNADVLSDYLDQEPPREGIEVTPVCPAELNNTNCVNPAGTVPGVKKFVYSKEFTLTGQAPDWKFVFLGETDASVVAGRSNSLTNVSPPGIIRLEATLDNTQFNNSSPEYTTIATPFYCINRPVNFNPGAVDANGDSLVYELVPALDTGTYLTYVQGFSGSNPLDIVPGAFKFSTKTGQLSFTAGRIQRSLVVYRVTEYRNGVLVGTSMREMTVVILPCNNNPPLGYISDATGAIIIDTVTVKTCKGNHEINFYINPTDADNGHNINVVANGLPRDAQFDITNNNTAHPQCKFIWNAPNLSDGDYTFYVTYTDDGCPIASKQTQAYTIRVLKEDIFAEATPAKCKELGSIKIITADGWSPWDLKLYQNSTIVNEVKGIGSKTWSDSIAEGKYKIEAVNTIGCTAEASVEVAYSCDIADLPTAFSPNNDGKNDILFLRGGNIKEMDLRIYNRWGQLMFETKDIAKGWDGKYKGQDAPVEAYAYVLSVVFNSGASFQRKGNITLLR